MALPYSIALTGSGTSTPVGGFGDFGSGSWSAALPAARNTGNVEQRIALDANGSGANNDGVFIDLLDRPGVDSPHDLTEELEGALLRVKRGDSVLWSGILERVDNTEPYQLLSAAGAVDRFVAAAAGATEITLEFSHAEDRVTGRLGISGTGASGLTVTHPQERVTGRLGIGGTGASGLTVDQPTPERVTGRLGIGGTGASGLTVDQPRNERVTGRLGISGTGASGLTVDEGLNLDLALSAVTGTWAVAGLANDAGDDLPIDDYYTVDDGTTLDAVQFRGNRMRILLSGRLASIIEDGLISVQDPAADPPVTWALLHGVGGYWEGNNTRYSIGNDSGFLGGTRASMNTAVRAKSVGDRVRLRLEPRPLERMSGRLGIGGTGASGLTVDQPRDERVTGRLGIGGTGASGLTVDQPGSERVTGRLGIRGTGSSDLTVIHPVERVTGRLGIRGTGSSGLTVRDPQGWDVGIRASAPEWAIVTAVEIEHPLLQGEPLRAVDATEDMVIEGNTYVAMKFSARGPNEDDTRAPQIEISMDNVGRVASRWIERAEGGSGATCRIMELPDYPQADIEWEMTMDVIRVYPKGGRISIRLGFDTGLNRPAVAMRHDPETSPGIF
ncbi:MAG: DUF1833 domain-containing protein [Gammaproteobacteria bacterium]|nr:DUF1833 domain-containing protein [Gammaproteobacteria bacterium]